MINGDGHANICNTSQFKGSYFSRCRNILESSCWYPSLRVEEVVAVSVRRWGCSNVQEWGTGQLKLIVQKKQLLQETGRFVSIEQGVETNLTSLF